MKPTEKFTRTLNAEKQQPPTSQFGTDNFYAKQINQSTQHQDRTILLSKVQGLLGWAKSNPQTNLNNKLNR